MKYRLRPSKLQVERLRDTLWLCKNVYNACLNQRKLAYESYKKSISAYDQIKQLPDVGNCLPEYQTVYSQALQDVVRRCDKSFQAFFRRVRNGEKPGYPRYKSVRRYSSFVYPQSGWKIEGEHIVLSKIGTVRIIMHRQIPKNAEIKTVTITRDRTDKWYVSFGIELPSVGIKEPIHVITHVGIDVGIKDTAVLSTGERIKNPKFLIKSERRLKRMQRFASKKKLGSSNRKKSVRRLAVQHRKVGNQRNDFLHKISRNIVNSYDMIIVEDLDINGLGKNNRLSKYIHDAGWYKLRLMIGYKAEDAGKLFITVDPKYTTQACSGCDAIVPKTLKDKVHECPHCGLTLGRDHNASLNILYRGLEKIGLGRPEYKPAEPGQSSPGSETGSPILKSIMI